MLKLGKPKVCYFHLRARRRLTMSGNNAPDEQERFVLRDCSYACNGIEYCSGRNIHSSSGTSICDGFIADEDVEQGKCVRRIKAENLQRREDKIDGYSSCLECSCYLPENHHECYEDIRDYLDVELIFRTRHNARTLRL